MTILSLLVLVSVNVLRTTSSLLPAVSAAETSADMSYESSTIAERYPKSQRASPGLSDNKPIGTTPVFTASRTHLSENGTRCAIVGRGYAVIVEQTAESLADRIAELKSSFVEWRVTTVNCGHKVHLVQPGTFTVSLDNPLTRCRTVLEASNDPESVLNKLVLSKCFPPPLRGVNKELSQDSNSPESVDPILNQSDKLGLMMFAVSEYLRPRLLLVQTVELSNATCTIQQDISTEQHVSIARLTFSENTPYDRKMKLECPGATLQPLLNNFLHLISRQIQPRHTVTDGGFEEWCLGFKENRYTVDLDALCFASIDLGIYVRESDNGNIDLKSTTNYAFGAVLSPSGSIKSLKSPHETIRPTDGHVFLLRDYQLNPSPYLNTRGLSLARIITEQRYEVEEPEEAEEAEEDRIPNVVAMPESYLSIFSDNRSFLIMFAAGLILAGFSGLSFV